MRDDKRRAAFHELVHTCLHDGLGAGVDGARGLVQNHRRRIGDGGACDRDQLALALRQLRAVASEHGVVAVGQAGDKVVRARELGCRDALLVCGIQVAVADVVHHGTGEQVHVLQYDAQRTTQVGLANLVDVDAVVADLAVGDVIEAVDEVGDRRLAGTSGTDKCDLLTRLGVYGHAVQHLVVGRVAKVNVVHDQVATQRHVLDLTGRAVRVLPRPHAGVMVGLLELPGLGVYLRVDERHVTLVGLGLLVEQLKDTLGAGEAHDHGVDLHRDLADLAAELLGHVEERYHHGNRERQARDAQVGHAQRQEDAACQRDQHVEQIAQVHEDGHQDVGVHVGLLRDLEEFFVALIKVGLGGGLVAECLDDLLTVHDLLDMALDHAELGLLRNEEVRGVGAEQLGHKGHKGDAGDDDQAHPHAVIQHDKEHGDDDDGRHEQVGHRLADHLAKCVDVVGVVAHDVAALVRVEVANRQVLHAVEHLLTQLLERALRDDGHGAVPEQRRGDAYGIDAAEGGHKLQNLGLRGRPVARLP